MRQYRILHIYNQCANTTIPLQAFLQIKDKSLSKMILSWNQEQNNENIKSFQKNSNVTCYGFGFKYKNLFIVLKQYYNFLKIEQPDLIHVHHSYSAFLGALIGKFINKKIVLTIHSDYSKYTFLNKILFLFSMLLSNKIIANSQNTFFSIPNFFREKTIVIYNGVEISKIIETKPKEIKAKDEFIICTVARLVKLKDIGTLINAFKLLCDKYDNIKLYILGDGPERKVLEELSMKYGLNHKIKFKGKLCRDDVYRILKSSDIFCSTSKWEGFGNAIVEAMAAKLAIVSTKIPAAEEVIGLENALYFDVGNYQKLFLQIEKLYLNDELKKNLAYKAFNKSKEFSIEKNVKEHTKLYKNLLMKKK